MSKTSLADLEERFGRKEAILLPWLVGFVAAVLPVAIILLLGWAFELLIQSTHHTELPASIALGTMLHLPTPWLQAFGSPLSALTAMIGMAVLFGCGNVVLLWWIYRWSLFQAIHSEASFRKSLFAKYHELAAVQGVSGQQKMQSVAVSNWIPQIRDGILYWYRNMPRHPLVCIACIIPSLLIHLPLTVLLIVSIVLLWKVNTWLDNQSRTRRPIYFDRSQSIQKSIDDLVHRGPLLGAVQPVQANFDAFDSHLRNLNELEEAIGNSYIWKRPAMALISIPVFGALGWIICVRILDKQATLNVSGALVMVLLVFTSSVSLLRATRSLMRRRVAEGAAQKLLAILDQPTIASGQNLKALPKLTGQLSIEHVTLKDSNGNKLLEDLSLTFRPGQLTAVLSTSRQDAEMLGELLLGFGTPIAGRVMWDDHLSSDISASSIRKRCLWIDSNGPLLSGTVRENLTLHANSIPEELVEALKYSSSHDVVFELPDNLDTLISASDDRFKGDSAFRLGIARAILAKPSLCIAYEPQSRGKSSDEIDTLRGLQHLLLQQVAVVVLAQRVSTLREADQIIVLHQHRVAEIGKHAELLEKSDLYRHMNYTMFSPMRQVHIDSQVT